MTWQKYMHQQLTCQTLQIGYYDVHSSGVPNRMVYSHRGRAAFKYNDWSIELLNGDSISYITHRQLGWYATAKLRTGIPTWAKQTDVLSQALIHLITTLWGALLHMSGWELSLRHPVGKKYRKQRTQQQIRCLPGPTSYCPWNGDTYWNL